MNATDLRALLARWAGIMADKRDWLIELDSVVGDSDLGLTMSDGFRAAADAAAASDYDLRLLELHAAGGLFRRLEHLVAGVGVHVVEGAADSVRV